MKTTVLAIALLTFAVGAHAQIVALPATAPTQPAPHPDVTIYTLTLHPMAPPRPALKYTLLPMPVDRTPGNAAALYYQAALNSADSRIRPTTQQSDPVYDAVFVPLEKLPRAEAAEWLKRQAAALALVDLAATRDDCRWEVPWREQGFATTLPQFQELRSLSMVLALRFRTELADRRFDQAARTLQSGFGMVRATRNGDFLVESLVGVGVGAIFCDRLREWSGAPGAPNLYWALADLPRPMVSLQRGMEVERDLALRVLPTLAKVRNGGLTAEDGEKLRDEVLMAMSGSLYERQPTPAERVGVGLLMTASAMRAKVYLLECGRATREVQEMEPAQALGLFWLETYERWFDELSKWDQLPYWLACEGAQRSYKAYLETAAHEPLQGMINPALMFMASLDQAHTVAARLDRELAMFQCIEALRAYAAAHGGKLPGRLEDMTDTPAPRDPMTNKPFEYRANGNSAVLDSKPVGTGTRSHKRYEITMEP